MRRWHILTLTTLLLLMASCGRNVVVGEYAIIPEPMYLVQKGRTFTLSSKTKFCFENIGQNNATAKYIANSLRQMHVRPAFIGTPHRDCITFTINDTTNPALGDEGYLLQVLPDGIFMSANTEAGLFYAYQTFVQMLPADIQKKSYHRIVMPECTILDHPRFEWRGSHLDVCRHFFTVEQIKKHLDLMAAYKLNRFHWHLTDDQGWRLEIEKYPQLNDIGSWRVHRTQGSWGDEEPARMGEEPTYGGYYTRKDIAEIVEYAAQRNIEVVPGIELPSHCSAVLAAYPQLACDDYPYTVALGPYWPLKAVLCLGNNDALQFVYDVLDEVCRLFPSDYIHIGGDVPYKENWEHCPKCHTLMHQLGLHNEEQLHDWFVKSVEEHLARKGRHLVGWDDITRCKSLSNNAIIMAWGGDSNTFDAALRGNSVIAANPDYCSLDYYQTDSNYHPVAFPQYLTLYKAYQYDPVPSHLTENAQSYIRGGACLLWSDYVPTYKDAQYQLLPRLCALAECFWSPVECKDWERFQRNIEQHKTRLRYNGYEFCLGSFKPIVTKTNDATGMLVSITTEVKDSYVYYTTDGSDPTPDSPLYVEPIYLPHGTLLRTLTLSGGKAREGIYDFRL